MAQLMSPLENAAHLLHHRGTVSCSSYHGVVINVELAKLQVQNFGSLFSAKRSTDLDDPKSYVLSRKVHIHTCMARNLQ